ncbi:MAG: DUF1080 domain-containing protein [Bacteroidota bacterium]
MKNQLFTLLLLSLLFSCGEKNNTSTSVNQEEWIPLFNGKDMNDWTPKFNGFKAGENYNRTFRVTDSLLQANYVEYDSFRNEFGHLFYKDKFSHYKLRAEYRFVGEHTPNGPAWAFANNGLMLHCQPVETMTVDQEFPVSIEFQLLGGNGQDDRPTGNLCTPGCHVTMEGALFTPHCVSSTSKTYHGEQWVTAEAIVMGDSIVHHLIEGDTVMTYTNPIIGGDLNGLDTLQFAAGTPMTEGYIAIQAESHNFDFKKIELLDLCGCMDKQAKNYKSYYVQADNRRCVY